MAKFFDGKVIPNSPQNPDPNRYQNLGLRETEPNLGVPEEDGYMLISDASGNREWVPAGLGPTSPFIPKDIINARGDIIIGSDADTPTVLSVAPNGCVLLSDSEEFVGVRWIDFAQLGVPLSIFDAKGSIVVAIASGNIDVLSVGSDGQVLVADSTETLGVKWETVTVSGIPETIIDAKGDIIVGQAPITAAVLPVGDDGYVLTADSAEPLGVKWAVPFNPNVIETVTYETEVLDPGDFQDFWLDFGQLFSFISVNITTSPEDGWLRMYTTEAGRAADTRVVPGPPFPSPSSGFALEIVTSLSEPEVILIPVPSIFTEDGAFFRFTNQSLTSQSYSLEFKFLTTVDSPCDLPPYGNNVYVNLVCVEYFNTPTGVLQGITPSLVYGGGTIILSEASNSYSGGLSGGSGSLGQFTLSRGITGDISSVGVSSGSGYEEGDTVTILGSLIGGVDVIDDVTVLLSRSNGMELLGAWEGGTLITAFPSLDVSNGLDFERTWTGCTSLTSFPAGMFDSCLATNFYQAWQDCALNQTSVDNILISLDSAGQSNGTVTLSGGTSAVPGVAGAAAKASLEGKGWVVDVNVAPLYCSPAYPLLPVSYPPYACNTTVNTAGVTDFSYAWDGCSITYMPCVDSSSVTDFSHAWNHCDYLTSFPQLNTSAGLSFTYSWSYCYALTSFPEIDASSGTNFTYSWAYSGLTSFPELDLSSGIDFYGTWAGCYYMATFDTVSMGNGDDFSYAWYYCTDLTSFPLADLSSGTNFFGAWYNCESLTSFPLIDLSSGQDFSGAWYSCLGLTSFPALNTSSGLDFSGAWERCWYLTSFSMVDVSSGTNFNYAWYDCLNLTSFPALDTSSGLEFIGSWYHCFDLTSFPLIDVSSGLDFTDAWESCNSLTSFPALNFASGVTFERTWQLCTGLTSFPLANFPLGQDFTNAWRDCSGLTSFPAIIFSSGTVFDSAWRGCTGLTSFPLADVSNGVGFAGAWQGCTGLTSFPALDFSSAGDLGGAWFGCSSLTSFPFTDLSNAYSFIGAWENCTSLSGFPAGMFDTSTVTNFTDTWYNCALDQTSVDNILVSLDTAGQSNGFLVMDGGTSSTPGAAGLAAKASLLGKGWVVATN